MRGPSRPALPAGAPRRACGPPLRQTQAREQGPRRGPGPASLGPLEGRPTGAVPGPSGHRCLRVAQHVPGGGAVLEDVKGDEGSAQKPAL
eukprot:11704526-Alexandrium_andersonii.AAC.1